MATSRMHVGFATFRVLDLYCCQGGASAGYAQAGGDPDGVDKDAQSRYPYAFLQGDALQVLDWLIRTRAILQYDLIHASPPCQRRTKAQKIQGREHPALIAPTRELLVASGVPYVIENVVPEDPELDDDPLIDAVMLCGTMFGLHTRRHRLFEASFPIGVPPHPADPPQVKMGRAIREGDFYQAVGNFSGVDYVRRDMGVPWMNRDGIRECIPPAYAAHVGREFLAWRGSLAAAA